MNKNTLKLTTGAMFIAIFTIILIINRQTGMMLEELIFYILPIPMVAYSAKFGLKSGIPVMIGMILMSLFFGTITTIFYAASECFIGLVLGSCLNKRVDATKTILLIVLLAAIANLLYTVIMAPVFGFNISEDIAQVREMTVKVMSQSGAEFPEGFFTDFLTDDLLMRMMVISMAVMGMVQGYITYVLSILILKRMRFPVERPKSLYEFYPPKASGAIAAVLTFVYMNITVMPFQNEILQTVLQTAGICAALYLLFFGFIGAMLLARRFIGNKLIAVIVTILVSVMMYYLVILLGVVYIMTDYHRDIMEGKL